MSALLHSSMHLEPSSSAREKCRILVDFDGTVAPDDPTDRLFERFADPAWRDIEDAWQAGRISSRECMRRQVALLRATPEELDDEFRNVRVDPGFHRFLRFCSRQGIAVTIVSDGLDRLVRAVLERERILVPFFANKLEWRGRDRWRLAFPYARRDCQVMATRKCSTGVPAPGGVWSWRRAIGFLHVCPCRLRHRQGKLSGLLPAPWVALWFVQDLRPCDRACGQMARDLACGRSA